MKKMTCRQLGGACELEFEANSFDEIAQMSRAHGMEMFEKGDAAHLEAMQNMRAKMQASDSMEAWMAARKAEFDALPDS